MILTTRHRARKATRPIGSLLTYIAALVVTFFAGPALLLILPNVYSLDWQLLSNIGQSFTGLSALLSAAALAAVAISIRIQAAEVRAGHSIAVFNAQKDLVSIALSDPVYISCVIPDGISSDPRPAAYNTLWLRYFELTYLTGNLAAEDIVFALAQERFVIPSVRDHWRNAREAWKLSGNDKFVGLVDEAYQLALAAAQMPSNGAESARHTGPPLPSTANRVDKTQGQSE